jgi:hypothetical protein
VKTESQQQEAYAAKTAATTVGLKIASRLGGMKTGFETAINSLVPVLQQIQGILNSLTVPTIQYPFYFNFGREIWALINSGIDGDTLEAQAQMLHDKYEDYGLLSANLIEIADTVFNITVT